MIILLTLGQGPQLKEFALGEAVDEGFFHCFFRSKEILNSRFMETQFFNHSLYANVSLNEAPHLKTYRIVCYRTYNYIIRMYGM